MKGNLYFYCENNPVCRNDPNGLKGKVLSTDNICDFGANDWGSNDTLLPVSVLINVAIGIYNEGDWKYKNGSLKYKEIDCIGLILLPAKFHFSRPAFRDTYHIGKGTNSAIGHKNTTGLKKFQGTDINELKIGTILYCPSLSNKKRGHVGIYIGYYNDGNGHVYEHAVIHCHGEPDSGITIESVYGSRFDCVEGEYTEYNYLEYDLTYEDTMTGGGQ